MRGVGWEPLIYGMVITYTDLPDGHHIGIISSQLQVPYESSCAGNACPVACSPVPLRNIFPFLRVSKDSASLDTDVLASLVWRLCCPSPFCHGNYVDDIVFLGWVWYVVFTHTQPLKEMSAGLRRRWWQTPWRVSPNRRRDKKKIPQGRTFKSFLSLC